MSVVWTRSSADWTEDAQHLVGIAAVERIPCVRIVPVTPPPPKSYDVYVVSSPHALAYFQLPPAAVVHTFGAATAAAARSASARVTVHAEARTAAELVPLLLAVLSRHNRIAIPGALVPAFDLAGALRGGGLNAESIACYATEALATKVDGCAFTDEEVAARRWHGVICFASPSAVHGFVRVFPAASTSAELRVACIGPTTAAAASTHFFKRVTIAAENTLASLVEAATKPAR